MWRNLIEAVLASAIIGLAAWVYTLQGKIDRTWDHVSDLMQYSVDMRIDHDDAIGVVNSKVESMEKSIYFLREDIQETSDR